MRRTLIFFLVILFSGNPALAETGSGNKLLERCKGAITTLDTNDYENADQFGSGICFGYLHGSRDAYDISVGALKFSGTYDNEITKSVLPCIPEQVQVIQLARILVKYLESHPEELHEDQSFLISKAFLKAFPCR